MSEIIVGIIQDEYNIEPILNFEKTKKHLINGFKEADIVLLPEYSMINILAGLTPQQVYERAESLEDSTYLSKMADLSAKIGVPILVHFIEKTDSPPKSYSSSILVEPSGNIAKVYSKIHLFDAYGYRESDYLLPGDRLSKTILIKGFTINIAICYDLRFPELFRKYAVNGANTVLVHAGWVKGPFKEEVLDTLAKSRSHENTMYLVVSNHTGRLYTGRSGVFNPYGYRELDMGVKPGYAEHKLSLSIVEEARRNIPVLQHSVDKWSIMFKEKV